MRLVPVDDVVLELLVAVATTDAAAHEVTPPLTPGADWTPARVGWLRAHHVAARGGLDGPAGEQTWAVLVDGVVSGAVRLARTEEVGVVETGLWLARGVRGAGHASVVLRLVLEQAAAVGATEVRAETTASNGPARAVLRRFGACRTEEGGAVRTDLRPLPAPGQGG